MVLSSASAALNAFPTSSDENDANSYYRKYHRLYDTSHIKVSISNHHNHDNDGSDSYNRGHRNSFGRRSHARDGCNTNSHGHNGRRPVHRRLSDLLSSISSSSPAISPSSSSTVAAVAELPQSLPSSSSSKSKSSLVPTLLNNHKRMGRVCLTLIPLLALLSFHESSRSTMLSLRRMLCNEELVTAYVTEEMARRMPERVERRNPPSHVVLCQELLERQNFVKAGMALEEYSLVEDQAVCQDWTAPHFDLMEIFASSLVAHVGEKYAMKYKHDCASTKDEYDPNIVNVSAGSDDGKTADWTTIQQEFPPSSLVMDNGSVDEGQIADLCRMCVAEFNEHRGQFRYAAAAKEDGTQEVGPEASERHLSQMTHHCLLFPESKNPLVKDSNEVDVAAIAEERALAQTLPLSHILPTVRDRLRLSAVNYKHENGSVESGEEENGAIIYIDEGSLVMPYLQYAKHIPSSVRTIDVLANAACASSVIPSGERCVDHGNHIRRVLQDMYPDAKLSFQIVTSTAASFSRMILAKYLICPPGTTTCLFPALAKEDDTFAVIAESPERVQSFHWFDFVRNNEASNVQIAYVPSSATIIGGSTAASGGSNNSAGQTASSTTVEAEPPNNWQYGTNSNSNSASSSSSTTTTTTVQTTTTKSSGTDPNDHLEWDTDETASTNAEASRNSETDLFPNGGINLESKDLVFTAKDYRDGCAELRGRLGSWEQDFAYNDLIDNADALRGSNENFSDSSINRFHPVSAAFRPDDYERAPNREVFDANDPTWREKLPECDLDMLNLAGLCEVMYAMKLHIIQFIGDEYTAEMVKSFWSMLGLPDADNPGMQPLEEGQTIHVFRKTVHCEKERIDFDIVFTPNDRLVSHHEETTTTTTTTNDVVNERNVPVPAPVPAPVGGRTGTYPTPRPPTQNRPGGWPVSTPGGWINNGRQPTVNNGNLQWDTGRTQTTTTTTMNQNGYGYGHGRNGGYMGGQQQYYNNAGQYNAQCQCVPWVPQYQQQTLQMQPQQRSIVVAGMSPNMSYEEYCNQVNQFGRNVANYVQPNDIVMMRTATAPHGSCGCMNCRRTKEIMSEEDIKKANDYLIQSVDAFRRKTRQFDLTNYNPNVSGVPRMFVLDVSHMTKTHPHTLKSSPENDHGRKLCQAMNTQVAPVYAMQNNLLYSNMRQIAAGELVQTTPMVQSFVQAAPLGSPYVYGMP